MKHTKTESHEIEIGEGDVAYIRFELGIEGKVTKTIRLVEMLKDYDGADVMFDFSEEGILLGIEIIA